MVTKLNKHKNLILGLILLFALTSRLIRIDFPSGYVFDEVYHAFTAKEYLKASKLAWDPWAKPPPGVAYEWTHPPLAKEIMASSMFWLHSTQSWAWRIPGVLLGTLSVFIVYLLGKLFFKKEEIALLAAFIFSLEGLLFVQSRTGMNDIYIVTFGLISLLFFIKRNFLTSAIFLGLALASKWTAVYLLGVYFILLLRFDYKLPIKQQLRHYFYFLAIPPIIYLLSYTPYFLLGYDWNNFVELQRQMWGYHTGLKATHDYASPWWSWPFNLYPVWYFVDYHNGAVANIFASGNLPVFIFGFVAIIASVIEFFKTRSAQLFIILAGYFAFWLPWALSPRIAFLYHYSPCIPFLSLALSYQLYKLYEDKSYRPVFYLVLLLMVSGFIFAYPFLTGIHIPSNFVNTFFETNLAKNPFK